MNKMFKEHGASQFKPNTTVAAIIHHQGKFLMVEELENGNTVFNQPAGHIEQGESLPDALVREVYEETGITVTPEYVSGVYHFYRADLDLYFIRFCFVINLNSLIKPSPQDDEIIAAHWLTFDEICQRKHLLRSSMVMECIEDYFLGIKNNEKIPLAMLKSNL